MTTEERLARLEYEVDILRRAILFMTASTAPAADWMAKKFEKGPPE